MGSHHHKKGVEIRDVAVGTGEEAAKDSVVVVNVREFLRRGDEASPSPLFGPRHIIDLGRRECIAGLRYGIPGMRVGGTREITISPQLAYGEAGIPGRIPANALLRCRVELLEIRQHSAILPEDWLPGKVMILRSSRGAHSKQQGWRFMMHESGAAQLSFNRPGHDEHQEQTLWTQNSIFMEAEKATELIREALDLPKEIPEQCVDWNSGFIDQQKSGTIIKDKRNGAHCMVVQVIESGMTILQIGVHEESTAFRDSAFSRTVEQLTMQHLPAYPASS